MKSSKVQKRWRPTIAAHALQRCTSKVPHLAGLVVIVLVGTMLTAGIAAAQSVALSGNHPEVAPELDTKLTSQAAASRPLEIRVSFALRNRAALDKLLSEQQDPASPATVIGSPPPSSTCASAARVTKSRRSRLGSHVRASRYCTLPSMK